MSKLHHAIERVGVVGAGTMGSGIAQVIAQAGIPVTMVDRREQDLQRGLTTITKSLERLKKKGVLDAEAMESIQARISVSTDTSSSTGCRSGYRGNLRKPWCEV